MCWDYNHRLRYTSRQGVKNSNTVERTYSVYDGSGQRIRVVTDIYTLMAP